MSALKPLMARLPQGASLTRWMQPQVLSRLLPVVVLAIGVTALVMMFMWQDQSSYKPVFGAREQVPAAELMGVLDAEGIAYAPFRSLFKALGQVLKGAKDAAASAATSSAAPLSVRMAAVTG